MASFLENIRNEIRFSNILVKLVLINVAIFIPLNLLLNFGINAVQYMAMPTEFGTFLFKPWTLITAMFSHADLGHILGNMLLLFFLGQVFTAVIGSHRVLFVYIASGICGGLLLLIAGTILPHYFGGYALGASAAVMGIIVAAGVYTPDMPVNLMFIGEIRLKWVVLFLFATATIIDFANNTGGRLAHLGGAVFGLIYALQLKKGNDLSSGFTSFLKRKQKSKLKVVHKKTVSDEVYNKSKADEQRMLDEILDKINRS
ncbi:MAG: rhomboid family intramembrane serine protease, partial [Bacteroidia bacterium]